MTVRIAGFAALALAMSMAAAPGSATPLQVLPSTVDADDSSPGHRVDYRPYYHCHGPKRCHGKGNYYTYTPTDAPIVSACRYGRGCGYNNGWNSPSSRYQYTGRRWHRHHRR
jgi:hypothetical protein